MSNLFGADGIRGAIDEYPLRRDDLERLGRCVGAWLLLDRREPVALIGTDTRESSQRIKIDLINGLTRSGVRVIDVGIIPTAGLSYLIASKGTLDGGIMITASHNPVSENGIKIFDFRGVKISESDETCISNYFLNNGRLPFRIRPADVWREQDYSEQYADSLATEFYPLTWNRRKIVVDCANGAAYQVIRTILKRLDLHAILLNANPTGININSDGGSEYFRLSPNRTSHDLEKYHAELGIALDGDADRAVFIDQHSAFYDGDSLLAIFANDLSNKQCLSDETIVTTPMSNTGLADWADQHKIRLVKVRNGDKYITDLLLAKSFVLGGEPIGHVILHTDPNRVTGDGIRTMLQVLSLICKQNPDRLENLTDGLRKRPQINVSAYLGFRTSVQAEEIPQMAELIQEVRSSIPDLIQFQCRPASTEPVYRIMMEAKETSTEILAAHAYVLGRIIQDLLLAKNQPLEILDCTSGGQIIAEPEAFVAKKLTRKLPQ